MPNKTKYESIRANPIRLAEYRKQKREWIQRDKLKHPFKWMCLSEKKHNNVVVKPFDLWKIAKKQRLVCQLTGRKLTAENISIDHIKPMSKGGSTNLDNVQLVDYNVNLAKHTLTVSELLCLCQEVVNHLN